MFQRHGELLPENIAAIIGHVINETGAILAGKRAGRIATVRPLRAALFHFCPNGCGQCLVRQTGSIEAANIGRRVQARNEDGNRMPLVLRDIALMGRFKQCLIALLRVEARFRPFGAKAIKGDPAVIPTRRSMTSVVGEVMVEAFSSSVGFQALVAKRRSLKAGVCGVQPRAGATCAAVSSRDRRICSCGGSTECTWKTRSVTRASAVSA